MKLPWWTYLPVFAAIAILALMPGFYLGAKSLFEGGGISVAHFSNLFLDARQLGLLLNSVVLAAATSLFAVILGVPLAFLAMRTNLWGKKAWSVIYLAPLLIPPYMHALMWTWFIDGANINNMAGAVLILSLCYFPFVSVMAFQGLKGMDRQLEEASLFYNGFAKTAISVTLPLIAPHIISGAVFVFVFAFTNFSVPDILRVKTYPVEIFIQFSALYDEKAAAVMALPMIAIIMAILLLQHHIMRGRPYVNLVKNQSQTVYFPLSFAQNLAANLFYGALMIAAIGLPLYFFLRKASDPAVYMEAISACGADILYSIFVAAAASVAIIFTGFAGAVFIERNRGKTGGVADYLAQIPFAIPAIVLGIGLIGVWNNNITAFIYASSLIVIIGYFANFITFGLRALQSGIKRIDPHLEEMGLIAGMPPGLTLRKITFRLVSPEVSAALFICFILCMGELGATLLVIPPGKATIPISIYNYMHYGSYEITSALCIILFCIMFFFSLALFQYQRKKRPLAKAVQL